MREEDKLRAKEYVPVGPVQVARKLQGPARVVVPAGPAGPVRAAVVRKARVVPDQHVYRGFVVHLTDGGEIRYAEGHQYALRDGAALQITKGDSCIDVMLIAPHEWKIVESLPPLEVQR